MDVPNAVEVVFKTPYAVPDDRTYAEIECTTQQIADAGSACTAISSLNPGSAFGTPTSVSTTEEATYTVCKSGNAQYWRNDPLHVFQNSVMFNGFGAGNCWYMGREAATTATNKHMFRCNNMGAVAANTEMSLAFQFTVRNQGKDMANTGLVVNVVSSLSCVLTLRTRQGSNTKTEWFT